MSGIIRVIKQCVYTWNMITPIKRIFLATCLTLIAFFSVQWALAGSVVETSAPISVNTCPAWRATAAVRRAWRGGQCQVQRPITATAIYTAYLPLIQRNYPIPVEFRGLWVTRFEWTGFGHTATISDLDTIVDHAAAAHFNALLFQVRGTADAYYSSTLEPWAARLTGSTTKTLGTDPGFDPAALRRFLDKFHQVDELVIVGHEPDMSDVVSSLLFLEVEADHDPVERLRLLLRRLDERRPPFMQRLTSDGIEFSDRDSGCASD